MENIEGLTSKMLDRLNLLTHDKLKLLGIESFNLVSEKTMSPRLYVHYIDTYKKYESYDMNQIPTFLDDLELELKYVMKKPFQTNNDESIILVYYFNVSNMSPRQADQEIRTCIADHHEDNPRIKQIYIPVYSGDTRVELIYPSHITESETMKKVQEMIRLSNVGGDPDKSDK